MMRKKREVVYGRDTVLTMYYAFLSLVFFFLLLAINYGEVKSLFAFDGRNLTASASMIIKPGSVSNDKLTGGEEHAFLESYGITGDQIAPLREEQER